MIRNGRTIIALALCGYAFLVSAGEIVLDKVTRAHHASEQRVHAKEYVPDTGAVSGVVSIVPGDEGDSLFPQHGADSLPEDGGSRGNAHSTVGEREGIQIESVPAVGVSRAKVDENLSKARAYMKNNSSQAVITLPVVNCEDVNNVSGRIGDDTLSGSVITIIQNGKQVKARCK